MEQVLSSSEGRENQPSPANILNLSKETGFILACTFIAFLIRFFVSRYENVIYWDGVYYAKLGRRIISGDLSGGISAYWSPLYSLLIGITSILLFIPAILISSIFSVIGYKVSENHPFEEKQAGLWIKT